MKNILSLDLDDAISLVDICRNLAKKKGFNVAITIVDCSCNLLCQVRHGELGPHTLSASYKKAFTACSQNRPSKDIHDGIRAGTIPQEILSLDSRLTSMMGGVPIVIDGHKVGAIGVGGAHGENDHNIAIETVDKWKNKGNYN